MATTSTRGSIKYHIVVPSLTQSCTEHANIDMNSPTPALPFEETDVDKSDHELSFLTPSWCSPGTPSNASSRAPSPEPYDMTKSNRSDSVSSSSSSSQSSIVSSDWDAHTIISTVSTVLPPKEPTHRKMQISQQFLVGFKKDDTQIDITYDLYQLFYPFTNLQSLLFSQIHPFTDIDYKKNKAFGNNESECFDPTNDVQMDWNDIVSINKIREFIKKILSSSSSNQGIKESEIYLMFSTPSPTEIIEQLRFGMLSNLCNVHMDRFGRRTYHYRSNSHQHRRTKSQLHFYNHSKCPSNMFAVGDMIGLSDFISNIDDTVDAKTEISHSHSQSVTINFHDNDCVMVNSSSNDGHTETEMQWQNYSIHQYLQRKRAFNVIQEYGQTLSKKVVSFARTSPKYKPPPPPNMEKHKLLKKNDENVQQSIQKIRRRKLTATIKKEGFLERESIRSLANIHKTFWMRFWCVLWNEQMLIYKNQDYIKDDVGRKLKQPMDRIHLNKIAVPISVSYDVVNKYHKLTLNEINNGKKYVFRTKSEHDRNGWLQEIDNMLDYENNVGQKNWTPDTPNQTPNLEDKVSSCLVM